MQLFNFFQNLTILMKINYRQTFNICTSSSYNYNSAFKRHFVKDINLTIQCVSKIGQH